MNAFENIIGQLWWLNYAKYTKRLLADRFPEELTED